MKCVLIDAVNEHLDSIQMENKNGVICCQYYSYNIEHHELGLFRNLRHEVAITPLRFIQ
jgi:hypothetical protein